MLLTNGLIELILIFSRVAGMFALVPLFGAKNSPTYIKVGFILILTVTLFPLVEPTLNFQVGTLLELGYHMVMEILMGLSFGLIITLMMNAIYLAGLLIDRNIGFAMVSVISAQDEAQIPVSANFYYLMIMLIFVITYSHHRVIRAVYHSLEMIPIGGGSISIETAGIFVNSLSTSFSIGFTIAAPFILTIMVVNIILGLLSKAMPGLNVFMVGMPIKVMVGLGLFTILVPYYIEFFKNLLDLTFDHLKMLFDIYL